VTRFERATFTLAR